jgi:hypothetical protein
VESHSLVVLVNDAEGVEQLFELLVGVNTHRGSHDDT